MRVHTSMLVFFHGSISNQFDILAQKTGLMCFGLLSGVNWRGTLSMTTRTPTLMKVGHSALSAGPNQFLCQWVDFTPCNLHGHEYTANNSQQIVLCNVPSVGCFAWSALCRRNSRLAPTLKCLFSSAHPAGGDSHLRYLSVHPAQSTERAGQLCAPVFTRPRSFCNSFTDPIKCCLFSLLYSRSLQPGSLSLPNSTVPNFKARARPRHCNKFTLWN